jgi:hypothetical protein
MSSKDNIGLAGEMRVASELLIRGYQASITFGNAKATDIVVLGDKHQFIRVEVKTCNNRRRFVTGYYPKYTEPSSRRPDVWVFYLPCRDADSDRDRFFILTHKEAGELQLIVNGGKKTKKGEGCDNIPVAMLNKKKDTLENRWSLFDELLNADNTVS